MMQRIPPVTRNLILINVICFLLQQVIRSIDITEMCGLHFVLAENFYPWQLVSYMFLHGSLTHLFFNMFSLWMFGGLIERTLGTKRFLTYFFVCGIGAGICQELWQTAQYFMEEMYKYDWVNTGGPSLIPMSQLLNQWTTIGASGACYGVLLAFGMLYPNERIMLLLPPIPMKAKYFVAGYAVIELWSAYSSNDNVAHLAHLGGMLFGWLLLRYWKKRTQRAQTVNGGWTQWTNASAQKPSWGERIKGWLNISPRKHSNTGNAHHVPHRPETDHEYNERRKREEERMDEILDKVRKSGYSGLTREEKEELFRLSRR